jgi:uncharacterized membrane protein
MPTGEQVFFHLTRYAHIFSGIMWIGLLYYLNFVQVPAFARMDAAARTNAVKILVPRVLLFFRMAALGTVTFGILYILGALVLIDGYMDSPRFWSIGIGGLLGIIMASNVWFIIWPNQKKIIRAAQEGKPPADPSWARKAFLASRTNTMLSIPMLFYMVGALHLPALWSGF